MSHFTRQEVIDMLEAGDSLSGHNLSNLDLSDLNLRGESLTECSFRYTNLRGTDLSDASLREADLTGANLEGANLEGADLSGAKLDVSWAKAIGLATPEASRAMLETIRTHVLTLDGLNMQSWHGLGWTIDDPITPEAICGTTHCLAGFAQAYSDDERIRSLPTGYAGSYLIPHAVRLFYEDEGTVLEWLERRGWEDEGQP